MFEYSVLPSGLRWKQVQPGLLLSEGSGLPSKVVRSHRVTTWLRSGPVWSCLAVSSVLPSGSNASHTPAASSFFTSSNFSASQSISSLSLLVASHLPSGLNAAVRAASVNPSRVPICSPLSGLTTRTVFDSCSLRAARLPSGLRPSCQA